MWLELCSALQPLYPVWRAPSSRRAGWVQPNVRQRGIDNDLTTGTDRDYGPHNSTTSSTELQHLTPATQTDTAIQHPEPCDFLRDFPDMADEVPQALKQADINLYKTATRAAQLQSVKPIIAYWCMFLVRGKADWDGRS